MTGSGLYPGKVMHARLQPFRHAFTYRVFSLLLDLDELDGLDRRLRLFSRNRFNMLSFHDRDHGDEATPDIRDWVQETLRENGMPRAARIRLLCFPRLWGFVFNPLAVYYCYDAQDRLFAVLHQVSNTFEERHSYLLPVHETGPVRQQADKRFHVSPFFDLEGGYAFRLNDPADTLDVGITYHDAKGDTRMVARQTGHYVHLTDRNLLTCVARMPLMTLKVVAGIHWEAFRLWRRGAKYHRKPAPPTAEVSSGTAGELAE